MMAKLVGDLRSTSCFDLKAAFRFFMRICLHVPKIFRTFAIRQMTGSSGRQRIPAMSLSKYLLVVPPAGSPIFASFGQMVEPLFRRVRIGRNQNYRLAGLRDTLLPKLLSGEVEFPEAEGAELGTGQ